MRFGSAVLGGTWNVVLGMVDLDAAAPGTYLAKAAQPLRCLQAALLRGAEMVEAQRDRAACILEQADQAASTTVFHVDVEYASFDEGFDTWAQCGDCAPTGAILIAQRQMEEHIGNAVDAECRESRSEPGSDTVQRVDRDALEAGRGGRVIAGQSLGLPRAHAAAGSAQGSSTIVASTSIAAPRGSAATCTQARAGKGSLKCRAITAFTAAKSARSVR